MTQASKLRRGFKEESERIAQRLRWELSLTTHDPLDCFSLARHFDIPCRALHEMRAEGLSETAIVCLSNPSARFSALTVCYGDRYLIVYNAAHMLERTANDVVHELAHIIHKHPPRPAISYSGCREWDERYEGEATWQAGALLVPRDGVLSWMRRGGTIEAGAFHFGVSRELFQWRVNVTGVTYQLARRRAS
jgi:Zn-dependent peptidase ImmA (M78 family)